MHIGPFGRYSEKTKIAFNKYCSEIQKEAKKKANISSCHVCDNKNLINSHSIPRFMLANIADNGLLYSLPKILNAPSHNDKGINNSGAFRLLCSDCDSKLFQFLLIINDPN